MELVFQSQQEALRILSDWLQNFAPADLIRNGELGQANAKALLDYIDQSLGGVITVSGLVSAEKALREAGKLQLIAPPSAEQVQIEAINEQSERWKRQHYEAVSQNKERNFAAESRAKAEAEARVKEQADAEATIQAAINGYTCNHPRLANHIDYARTEQFRKDLRKIEVRKNGTRDAVLTLKAVREAISNLPG